MHTTVINQTTHCLMKLTNRILDQEIGLWKYYTEYYRYMVLWSRQSKPEGLEHVPEVAAPKETPALWNQVKKPGKGSELRRFEDVHDMLRIKKKKKKKFSVTKGEVHRMTSWEVSLEKSSEASLGESMEVVLFLLMNYKEIKNLNAREEGRWFATYEYHSDCRKWF